MALKSGKNENIRIALLVAFGTAAGGGYLESRTRLMSDLVSVPVSIFTPFDHPENRGEGFGREAQDHLFAKLYCDDIANNISPHVAETLPPCRAVREHSIFYGPTFRELLAQEILRHFERRNLNPGIHGEKPEFNI